jgi:two-component system NtrC family sensor kinase
VRHFSTGEKGECRRGFGHWKTQQVQIGMKLANKLGLALMVGIFLVLGVMGTLMLKREAALIEANAREDLASVGWAIRPAFVATWRNEGLAAALALLEYTDESVQKTHQVGLRWVPVESLSAQAPKHANLEPLARGQQVEVATKAPEGRMLLYLPVRAQGLPLGAIELSKSLEQEQAFIQRSVQTVALTTLLLATVLGGLSLVFGTWLVGRPLGLLAEQARKVAAGDFQARVSLKQKDEAGVIAREMNVMADRLLAAREKMAAEHEQRLATLQQLRHTDRLATVGKLAAGIAHELGTPLSVVIGRAKFIAASDDERPQTRTSARIISEQGERIVRIIRQLLNFARRRGGEKVRADVLPIARQTLNLLGPMAKRHGVELKLTEDAAHTEAVVEITQLEQALANLVVNGIQAMSRGGTLTVGIHEEVTRPPLDVDQPEGRYLALEVKDEGEGIPENNLAHVFDPFFTTKPVGEGTGLGLSVAYGIAREHGGWIDASSQQGQGSSFVIHLPLAEEAHGVATSNSPR